jgi:hypothetical protein
MPSLLHEPAALWLGTHRVASSVTHMSRIDFRTVTLSVQGGGLLRD